MIGFIILPLIVNAQVDHFYEIEIKYDRGRVSFNSIQIKPLLIENGLTNLPGGFVAKIVDFDDNILNITFFDIPLEFLYDNIDEETGKIVGGGLIELEESETIIRLPYYKNAKEIIIYNKELKELARKKISEYSKIRCGDSVCQASESYKICKEDCPSGSKDGYCDREKEGICDPDCTEKTDADCKGVEEVKRGGIEEKITENWQIILVILILFAILIFFLLHTKKR